MKKAWILVVGSVSIDYVVECDKKPLSGETCMGTSFHTYFGGKGANQAIAAAKLGCDVQFLGCVGKDDAGRKCIENLNHNGVSTDYVNIVEEDSGSAHIVITEKDNSIIVVSGANLHCSKQQIDTALLDKPDLVILQNEITMASVEYTIERCYEEGIPIIYNPAPAKPILEKTLRKATYITPNESEFALLFPKKSQEEILKKMSNQLILTLGEKGVAIHDGSIIQSIPAYDVEVVDTTGAGDTFNGVLGFSLLRKYPLKEAVQIANLAAALSIQEKGAQGGIPSLAKMKASEMYEKKWNIE
ncbi:MAG: ribokinase [Breznakia sp.]